MRSLPSSFLFRLLPAIVAYFTAAFAHHAAAAGAPVRPNVLFIVVDDLNTAVGCYGDRLAKTPNIDRLAARGTRFDRAFCQYPLCNPSRVSFLSGRRPESTGVYALTTAARTALPDGIMLPQFFRQHGYYTAGAGKIFHTARMSDSQSWDRYEDGEGEDPQEQGAIKARYGGGDGRPAWHELDSEGEKTRDGLNARTIRALVAEKSATGQPFFLAEGFHKPHLPWTAPRSFFALHREADFVVKNEPKAEGIPTIALQTELSGFAQPDTPAAARRAYYACVSFMDHQVGLLLDELDRRNLWQSTLVVFFSDHGFHLGDHGGLWAKLSAFEISTRVPLIVAGPGVPAKAHVDSPVELIDVYPTLVDLAGFGVPSGLDGRSLSETWKGSGAKRPAYSIVYHYDAAHQRDVLGRSVMTEAWRYTTWDDGNAGRELYRQANDSGEYRNRAQDAAERETLAQGEALAQQLPPLKPGRAERPRALLPATKKK